MSWEMFVYDSTGFLGMDNKKKQKKEKTIIHTVKWLKDMALARHQIDHILMTKRQLRPEQFPLDFSAGSQVEIIIAVSFG